MVCPYCSTDMTPIELNGKVFCSNCGLTVANNSPAPVVNAINPASESVSNVETNNPDEISFPVIPEVAEGKRESAISDQVMIQPATDPGTETMTVGDTNDSVPTQKLSDPFGQFASMDPTSEAVGRKLEVVSEESTRPITEAIAHDLGISTEEVTPEVEPEPIATPEPSYESKISELSIPTEEDFNDEPETTGGNISSYLELSNPGNEQATLEASGILLDILGEEQAVVPEVDESDSATLETQSEHFEPKNPAEDMTLNPVENPEIPAETLTEEDDDIFILPSKLKVGLRSKKANKTPKKKEKIDIAEAAVTPLEIDPKVEAEIEKLEETIEAIPEPVVELTSEEAAKYDPDTIDEADVDMNNEKAKVIKDYFSTAIEKDKITLKKKAKQKKKKNNLKMFIVIALIVGGVAILSTGSYFAYKYYNPAVLVQQAKETAVFSTKSPSFVPDGYVLTGSNYSSAEKTFTMAYNFSGDKAKTITFKQIQTDSAKQYIADYVLRADTTFIEKEVAGISITEVAGSNLVWAQDNFVFTVETKNFTFTTDLLYKMAEMVQ